MRIQTQSLTEGFGTIVCTLPGQSIAGLDREALIDLYKSSGAVLFRGFNVSRDQFVAFSNQFFRASEHPVRTPDEEPGSKGELVYDVDTAKTGGNRSLHSEASDSGPTLDMCWFFCQNAPPVGGETTLGDGIQVLDRLSESTLAAFRANRIAYKWTFPEAQWTEMCGTSDREQAEMVFGKLKEIQTRFAADGSLDLIHSAYAIRPTRYSARDAFVNAVAEYLRGMEHPADEAKACVMFEDGSPIPSAIASEIESACETCEYPLRWNNGDMVMVDNSRVMHGRREWPIEYPRAVYARFGHPTF